MESIDDAAWYNIGWPAENILAKLVKLLQRIILMETTQMLELRVFTSFKKRTDKAQYNKELKANSTFDRRDKSIPTFMVKRVTTGYLYRHHNIYTIK